MFRNLNTEALGITGQDSEIIELVLSFGFKGLDLDLVEPAAPQASDDLLALDEALEKLTEQDSRKAELVKLRYFAGLTLEQCAEMLGISLATANRWWNYARAWLHQEISAPMDGRENDR